MTGEVLTKFYFRLFFVFVSIRAPASLHSDVLKVEGIDNYVSIFFDKDMDTTGVLSKNRIFPELSGFWQWRSPRELVFVSDSNISDTTIYILSLNLDLKDDNGSAIEDTDLIFTISKSISYPCYQIPFEWESVDEWSGETDWKDGQAIYKIKPKMHPSYRKIVDILFCWRHIYRGPLKQDYGNYYYPHFISSEGRNYKVSIDSTGFLYLFDVGYRMRYRWMIFPAKQYYHDLDVSDQGEALIAFSPNACDSIIMVHLISPTGDVIWTERYFRKDGMDIEIKFINKIHKFLIRLNEEIYCYKMLREQD